jgi:hypothetical protein
MPAPFLPSPNPPQPSSAGPDDPPRPAGADHPRRPSAPPSTSRRLQHLVRALLGDAPATSPPQGQIVATVTPVTDEAGVDLLVRPLEGHPADVLTGFVAPAEWSGLGVVVPGRSFHLPGADGPDQPDEPDDPDDPPLGDREPIELAYLVARDAASASACRRPDGTIWSHAADGLDDAAFGRIDDVLRRALGLPTHPPASSPVELWARLWLDRIVGEVAARPARRWSWPTIALLHPAARLVLDDLAGRPTEVADSMPRLAEMLGHGRTWSDLRREHVSADWEAPAIPADVAEWMDDGIFSRWLLDAVPACGDTLALLCDLLPQRLIARIERTVRRWGVSTAATASTTAAGLPPPWPPADEGRRP